MSSSVPMSLPAGWAAGSSAVGGTVADDGGTVVSLWSDADLDSSEDTEMRRCGDGPTLGWTRFPTLDARTPAEAHARSPAIVLSRARSVGP